MALYEVYLVSEVDLHMEVVMEVTEGLTVAGSIQSDIPSLKISLSLSLSLTHTHTHTHD